MLAERARHLAKYATPASRVLDRMNDAKARRYGSMDHRDTELEQAREELTFWRDYAVWWNSENGDTSEPRLLEVLQLAEQRYREASLRHRKLQLLKDAGA